MGKMVSIAAAEHYDVSRQTVRRWIARGKIHAYRVEPRLIRVDLDEIEAEIIHTVPTVTLSRADVQKRRADVQNAGLTYKNAGLTYEDTLQIITVDRQRALINSLCNVTLCVADPSGMSRHRERVDL
jgi:excisionase family DNA binding protein